MAVFTALRLLSLRICNLRRSDLRSSRYRAHRWHRGVLRVNQQPSSTLIRVIGVRPCAYIVCTSALPRHWRSGVVLYLYKARTVSFADREVCDRQRHRYRQDYRVTLSRFSTANSWKYLIRAAIGTSPALKFQPIVTPIAATLHLNGLEAPSPLSHLPDRSSNPPARR